MPDKPLIPPESEKATGSNPVAPTTWFPPILENQPVLTGELFHVPSVQSEKSPQTGPTETDAFRIPIYNKLGETIAFALVDPIDAPQAEHRWYLHNGYARRHVREPKTQRIIQRFLLHRVVINAPQGMDVDHLNGNRLDARRSNLRVVTTAENIQNRTKLDTRNKSGYRGVYLNKNTGKWHAEAFINGKKYFAGEHDTPEAAGHAAEELRTKLGFHGSQPASSPIAARLSRQELRELIAICSREITYTGLSQDAGQRALALREKLQLIHAHGWQS